MKRWLSYLLLAAMVMVLLCGCGTDKTSVFDRHSVSEDVIAAQQEEFGQYRRFPALKDNFSETSVVITVYPFAAEFEYLASDFADIKCTDVRDADNSNINPERPSRKLVLTLDTNSKQDIIDAMMTLLERDDVYSAEPVGWFIVN